MSLIEKNEVLALIDEIINRDHLTAMARLLLLRCEVYELPPAESDLTESVKAEGGKKNGMDSKRTKGKTETTEEKKRAKSAQW